jgi:hypothetical protein
MKSSTNNKVIRARFGGGARQPQTTVGLPRQATPGKVLRFRKRYRHIRQADASLDDMGIYEGDTFVVDLETQPADGDLALLYTAYGALVVRYVYYQRNGDIRVEAANDDIGIELYAPKALIIFGRVARVLTGQAAPPVTEPPVTRRRMTTAEQIAAWQQACAEGCATNREG